MIEQIFFVSKFSIAHWTNDQFFNVERILHLSIMITTVSAWQVGNDGIVVHVGVGNINGSNGTCRNRNQTSVMIVFFFFDVLIFIIILSCKFEKKKKDFSKFFIIFYSPNKKY